MPIGIYKHHSQQGFQKGHSVYGGFKTRFKKGFTPYNKGRECPEISERQKGEKSSSWKGGKIVSHNRFFIFKPGHPFIKRYIRQSRLVAEKCLGRYLTKQEVIHHINENTLDDRPENLYLFPFNSVHIKFHRLKNKPILKSNL